MFGVCAEEPFKRVQPWARDVLGHKARQTTFKHLAALSTLAGLQITSNLDFTSQAKGTAFPTLTAETLTAARIAGALGSFAGFEATSLLDVKAQIAGGALGPTRTRLVRKNALLQLSTEAGALSVQ